MDINEAHYRMGHLGDSPKINFISPWDQGPWNLQNLLQMNEMEGR
jgi:hypothetical protein